MMTMEEITAEQSRKNSIYETAKAIRKALDDGAMVYATAGGVPDDDDFETMVLDIVTEELE